MDRQKMEQGIRLFLEGVGERFAGDDLEKTPTRVARAWAEDLISGYALDPVKEMTWGSAPDATGTVFLRDVRFSSICVHHLLPFVGRAHVAYLPDRRLAGLSKIGRVIDALSRRLQIQEHLTHEIVETLDRALEPRGVLALLEAEHTCMSLRGVRKESSRMVTVAASGVLETDSDARSEVLRVLSPIPADSGFLT
jgi:GTP cyclohydrolase I